MAGQSVLFKILSLGKDIMVHLVLLEVLGNIGLVDWCYEIVDILLFDTGCKFCYPFE